MTVLNAFELDAERRHAIAAYILLSSIDYMYVGGPRLSFDLPDLGIRVEFPVKHGGYLWADGTLMHDTMGWREECIQLLLRP